MRAGCSSSISTRINELADHPEFYNLLTNSCTINIVRYANAAGRAGRFDIRHLLNGLIDSYLYHSGRIDTTLPFDELRRRSLINGAAQAADGAAISRSESGHPCQRCLVERRPRHSDLRQGRCGAYAPPCGRTFISTRKHEKTSSVRITGARSHCIAC